MRRQAGLALVVAAIVAGSGPVSARPAPSLTERNRAVVKDFAHRFYDLKDVRGAFEAHVARGYVQHNPNIADGREAAVKALGPIFSAPGSVFEIKRIVVDGDTAVIHLRGRSGAEGQGGSVADIYRLQGGKIVEHWDVLQPIQPTTINPHPYF
ncbi:nuclear transport factor 2 family protein [Novosphingobium flavum]|uniref:Nuclear transport factor 2 family protein n=1 Tax=Novosphingobium flavum TaxID=1778672 RepID=A0A7X1FR80_9SPHN|nr:nuclear transport factor 2 family protein [Novosphingobium flavum]MBC2665495.1 nuclear transport factor 2 family protein [Novosphingobium flavum]